jgi:hypothetical protein
MRKKLRDYSQIKYDDIPKVLEPGERKVINCRVIIDYSVFRKTPEEKTRLKIAKSMLKSGKKYLSPARRKRYHEFCLRRAARESN